MNFSFGDNRGSALVELALTAPLFFLLIMGSLEIGRVAYYSVEIENAARAGASFGAVNVQNANTVADVQQAAKNDAPDVSNLIVVSPGQVCVCETITTATNSPAFNPTSGTMSCTNTTITSCTAESSSSFQSVISYITVSTSATVNPLIHIPGLPNTYNLNGYSALRILTN